MSTEGIRATSSFGRDDDKNKKDELGGEEVRLSTFA